MERQPAKSFEELIVWQKAHAMVIEVYKQTKMFPKEEIYGISSQLRRSAVSVPANIAEGFAKRGVSDKLRFYNIAQGSLEECRYYSILSRDLGYITIETFEAWKLLIIDISQLLNSYINSITSSTKK